LWKTRKTPATTYTTPVFPEEDHFFTVLDDSMVGCFDGGTGEEIWKTVEKTHGKMGAAHMVANGDRVFFFNQRGQLVLTKLTKAAYEEIGRCLLVEPTVGYRPAGPQAWAHPAFANQSVYARNDKELICASLAAADAVEEVDEEVPRREADRRFSKVFSSADPAYSLAFSPDGKQLAGGMFRGGIKIADWASGEELVSPGKHKRVAVSVACSPDGKVLVSGGGTEFFAGGNDYQKLGEVRVWDLAEGKPRGFFRGLTDKVFGVAFSKDGKTIATGSADRTVRLWDATTMKERIVMKGHVDGVSAVAYSPDGTLLVSADWDGTIRFWDPVSGEARGEIAGHPEEIRSVAFSPDGKTIATGGADWMVRLWDAATKEALGELEGHRGTVYALAFSPDGKTMATGSGDETVRLWDVAGRSEREVIRGHESGVVAVVFARDGKSVVSAGREDGVLVWPLGR
jgi:WD40 repeat protein